MPLIPPALQADFSAVVTNGRYWPVYLWHQGQSEGGMLSSYVLAMSGAFSGLRTFEIKAFLHQNR